MADGAVTLKNLSDKSLLDEIRDYRNRLAQVLWQNRRLSRELAEAQEDLGAIADALITQVIGTPPSEDWEAELAGWTALSDEALAKFDDFCDEGTP